MLHPDITKLLNEQINKEFYSAYLYLAISNYYADNNLNGFENWFFVQAQEERDHALLFIKYMQNNDIKVTLEAIGKPDVAIRKHIDPLCASLTHEQFVTASIHAIYEAAFEARDFRTMQFLDWFVKEQAEEETNANDNIRKMELFGSESKGLFMLDQEMGARMYSPPSLVL
jgi:ferritin